MINYTFKGIQYKVEVGATELRKKENGITGEVITNHYRHATQNFNFNYHSTFSFFVLINLTIHCLKLLKFMVVSLGLYGLLKNNLFQ